MPEWIKASRSYGNGECVELADAGDRVLLRDSKAPDDKVASICKVLMGDFIATAKRGDLDHLVAEGDSDSTVVEAVQVGVDRVC